MQLSRAAAGFNLPLLAKLLLIVALIISGNYLAGWMADMLSFDVRPSNEDLVHRSLMIAAAVYAGLIAIPFVPGVELGLAIIAMLGPAIVWLIYLSTLLGLTIAYTIGRLVPLTRLVSALETAGLVRAAVLLRQIEPLAMEQRLAFLTSHAPSRVVPFLLRHRYLALLVAINIPGNFLIGGGGGISMIAGFSRLFSVPGFLATIALAVAPVPLMILIFGQTAFLN